jgi:RNA polymerase sigma-70 factor (ECF subfamily)
MNENFTSQENEFIETIKSGDWNAFRILVEEHQLRVINICLGFLKNESDAEDTAQEVFIEIFRSIKTFRMQSKLSTWIYRIAVSKSLDAIRQKNRKRRLGAVKQLLHIDDDETGEIPVKDESVIQDAGYDLKLHKDALYKAIEKLPESQKIAITLTSLQNFSYSEVAEITGNSVNSVEALIFRARKNLKKYLKTYYLKEFK